MDKLRGPLVGQDLCNTITDIYKSMFNYTNGIEINDEEYEIMEELKKELIQEEMEWYAVLTVTLSTISYKPIIFFRY